MSETKFHTNTNHRQICISVYCNFYVVRQQMGRQKVLDWMVASIARIRSALNFLLNKFWFVTVVPKYLNCATFSNNILAIFMFWFCPAFWWRGSNIYSYLAFSAFTSGPTSLLASIRVCVFFFTFSYIWILRCLFQVNKVWTHYRNIVVSTCLPIHMSEVAKYSTYFD
jgi:hypothetical protein